MLKNPTHCNNTVLNKYLSALKKKIIWVCSTTLVKLSYPRPNGSLDYIFQWHLDYHWRTVTQNRSLSVQVCVIMEVTTNLKFAESNSTLKFLEQYIFFPLWHFPYIPILSFRCCFPSIWLVFEFVRTWHFWVVQIIVGTIKYPAFIHQTSNWILQTVKFWFLEVRDRS